MRVRVSDIAYDTDGEEIEGLPSEMTVDVDSEEEAVDAVSDKTGWCILSARVEVLPE